MSQIFGHPSSTPLPRKQSSIQSSVRRGSTRILYLGPRPKSFLKSKPSCNTTIKMTTEDISSCGVFHIWFRPSGLWEENESVWFVFIHISVSLPCSQFAKISIICVKHISNSANLLLLLLALLLVEALAIDPQSTVLGEQRKRYWCNLPIKIKSAYFWC